MLTFAGVQVSEILKIHCVYQGCASKLVAFFNEKLMILIYAGLGIGGVEVGNLWIESQL